MRLISSFIFTKTLLPSLIAVSLAFGVTACGDETEDTVEIVELPCMDETILELNLQDQVAPGEITNTDETTSWLSVIDATAGGYFATTPDSFVYAKFTDNGLQKLALGDEDALESTSWDIAFRRYIVRINSGYSGPSSVTAALMPTSMTFDGITSVPAGTPFMSDTFMTPSCDFVTDGTGMAETPATALNGYWEHLAGNPGCVGMTDANFIIERADGRHVKATVEAYYYPDVQATCDATNETGTMTNAGSANFSLRWAFID